jgi:hypothetical protein
MAESLVLPLKYHGKELEFEVRAFRYGYTHHVEVIIEGQSVIFEPDEEGNYRALVPAVRIKDFSLVCAIARSLDDLTD